MMFLQHTSRALRAQRHLHEGLCRIGGYGVSRHTSSRDFHSSSPLRAVKPVLLADIGEGIVECEIIQWFVEPDARVEEFSPLCEVQSDKASVEITSRFSGVVKKLYYDAGEMAKVGKPFVDIDIQGDAKQEDLEALTPPEPKQTTPSTTPQTSDASKLSEIRAEGGFASPIQPAAAFSNLTPPAPESENPEDTTRQAKGRLANLATPAVRHLTKEHKVDISDISGTGKDGRVMKEDVFKFIKSRDNPQTRPYPLAQPVQAADGSIAQTETTQPLTNTQYQMFKAMTRSLAIPHFLYADEIDFSALSALRTRLNRVIVASNSASASAASPTPEFPVSKLTYLPFVIKALSLALNQYPVLNARVSTPDSTSSNNSKPVLIHRAMHNIGVAMDTPQGLLVPVIKAVNTRSILSIAAELSRLQSLASTGRLAAADMSGGTITVSNIGNIGGTYLSPVIVEREVAILGIGRVRAVPAFGGEDGNQVIKKDVCNFSWSADHRVVDGATLARAAQMVHRAVEDPDLMVMQLK